MQAVRPGMHARTSHRSLDGFFRRSLRSVLQLRTPEDVAGHDRRSCFKLTMSAAPPKVRFRDTQIEMAHGAGGKASRRLVEGLFAPLLFGASAEPLADAAPISIEGSKLAITTDSF